MQNSIIEQAQFVDQYKKFDQTIESILVEIGKKWRTMPFKMACLKSSKNLLVVRKELETEFNAKVYFSVYKGIKTLRATILTYFPDGYKNKFAIRYKLLSTKSPTRIDIIRYFDA